MLHPSKNHRSILLVLWPRYGMRYIILIENNFSKFVGLYPSKTVSTLEFVKAFLSYVGLEFLVSPRSSEAMKALNSHRWWRKKSKFYWSISISLLSLTVWMAERRMKEVGAHLRSSVYEYQIRVESLSATVSTNNQLYSGRVHRDRTKKGDFWRYGRFGSGHGARFVWGTDCRILNYLSHQSSGSPIHIDYLRKHQRKRAVDGGPKNEVTFFLAGDYVLPILRPKQVGRYVSWPNGHHSY